MEIKRRLEKEEEAVRKSLADLARATDESEEESDEDEQATDQRKDPAAAPAESANTSRINTRTPSPAHNHSIFFQVPVAWNNHYSNLPRRILVSTAVFPAKSTSRECFA